MIRFGMLGAAKIAPRALLDPCTDENRAEVHCIAARDPARAENFAREHGIPSVHAEYRDVIDDPAVDAVYIPLPISAHHRWTLEALQAGKHVLCEKSFASNAAEAEEMARAARSADRVVMDAFHYRYHPVFARAREIVESGGIGRVSRIEADVHVAITNPADIRMNYETGGGVTMDIGCYPISWARHITGEEPSEVRARAEVGPPGVDLFLQAQFRFPSGIEATLTGDMRPGAAFRADLKVFGELGTLFVRNPLAPQMGHSIEIDREGRESREELSLRPSYAYQLDAFIDAIEKDQPVLTGPDDAVNQMRAIDRCYEAAGLPLRGN